jgi:flavin reductase (DIM6/NTAB) family NADH-FMN oxidoreductase RutF
VVHIYVRDDLINDRHHIDPDALAAVGRMAGITYCTTRDRFEVPFGKAALDA